MRKPTDGGLDAPARPQPLLLRASLHSANSRLMAMAKELH
jgi:hypothetical protein